MFRLDHILKENLIASYVVEEGIPCFSPKSEIETAYDKYESIENNIDFYTWLAYGHRPERNVYARVNDLLHEYLKSDGSSIILDVGCGVGRTIYDIAEKYRETHFIGFDYSLNMLQRSKQILIEGGKLLVDLSSSGFQDFDLKCKKLNNVHLVQGSVNELPFKPNSFDVLVNTFLIDRVENVRSAIEQMALVLKPGGLFVLASPLNFQTRENWKYGQTETLVELIKSQGIEIVKSEGGIPHKEVLDARGNFKMWQTLIIWGRKSNPL